MQVLDDLGDSSSDAVREEYFAEIDEDGSGAIDFEEFLGVSFSLLFFDLSGCPVFLHDDIRTFSIWTLIMTYFTT